MHRTPTGLTLVGACLVLLLAGACANDTPETAGASGASNAVAAAALKTRNASSFSFDLSLSMDGTAFPEHGQYEAPDRIQIASTGGPSGTVDTKVIAIGDTRYSTEPNNLDRWEELTIPASGLSDLLQGLDLALRATDVTQSSDGTYTFSSRTCAGEEARGTARLSRDGYLSEVHTAYTTEGHQHETEQSFSGFGEPVDIQPPDPSTVRSLGTATPPSGASVIHPTVTCEG